MLNPEEKQQFVDKLKQREETKMQLRKAELAKLAQEHPSEDYWIYQRIAPENVTRSLISRAFRSPFNYMRLSESKSSLHFPILPQAIPNIAVEKLENDKRDTQPNKDV